MYKGFELTAGATYKNRNGLTYKCVRRAGTDRFVLRSTSSGWTFTAAAITAYEDGTIEWDYSTGGRFE